MKLNASRAGQRHQGLHPDQGDGSKVQSWDQLQTNEDEVTHPDGIINTVSLNLYVPEDHGASGAGSVAASSCVFWTVMQMVGLCAVDAAMGVQMLL